MSRDFAEALARLQAAPPWRRDESAGSPGRILDRDGRVALIVGSWDGARRPAELQELAERIVVAVNAAAAPDPLPARPGRAEAPGGRSPLRGLGAPSTPGGARRGEG